MTVAPTDADAVTLAQAAQRVGVTPGTLRRWVRTGLIGRHEGNWTSAAVAQARLIARLRDRGYTLAEIGRAVTEGRLAFGFLEELFPSDPRRRSVAEASSEAGLDLTLTQRLIRGLGVSPEQAGTVSEDEVQLLRYAAAALEAGLPLPALVQLSRVYGQAIAQIADAESRLFHLYVHEPLMRSGASGVEIVEQIEAINRQVLPLVGPVFEHLHKRHLRFFAEQDAVSHMESDGDGSDLGLGRMRVSIAFADLAGYTELTEEQGDGAAVDAVERFIEAVQLTLPQDARVIKTVGDEAMIIGSDASALAGWAVDFERAQVHRPRPRIAVHAGAALYRDGDYYGRDINIASRVAARAAGGEVLVTRPVAVACASQLRLEAIGELALKGIGEPIEVYSARRRDPG